MNVRWMAAAKQDRANIIDYIATNSPHAALKMDQLFSDAVDLLAAHPQMGKIGKISGTREIIPHESYRLVYEIDDDTVWVLALVHTARQWPPERG